MDSGQFLATLVEIETNRFSNFRYFNSFYLCFLQSKEKIILYTTCMGKWYGPS